MATKAKEIVVKEHPEITKESTSVESFITQALANNVPIETLERLLAMREKVNQERNKSAFVAAVSYFQETCPIIEKKQKVLNKDGRSVRYQYASLDSIISQIKTPLKEAGLSYSWDVEHLEGHMKVTITLTHTLGHSTTSTLEIPISDSAFMTGPQTYASAQTFAKRYTLLNVLGIATADEDTDAVDVAKKPPADANSPKSRIVLRLRALGAPTATKEEIEEAVLKFTKLDLIPENYEEIGTRLQVLIDDSRE